MTAQRALDDVTPLGPSEARVKVLRSGFSPADDRPQCCHGQLIRMALDTAQRAAGTGAVENTEKYVPTAAARLTNLSKEIRRMFSTLKNLGDLAIALQIRFSRSLPCAGTLNGASIDGSRTICHSPAYCTMPSVRSAAPHRRCPCRRYSSTPRITRRGRIIYTTVCTRRWPGLTAANTDSQASIDLTAAQRYVQAVTVISFTGGRRRR